MEGKIKLNNTEGIENLKLFKEEIEKIKEEEVKLREAGEKSSAHLQNCDPKDLEEIDRQIYLKVKDINNSVEELVKSIRIYQKNIQGGNQSQKIFSEYLLNIVAARSTTEQLQKMRSMKFNKSL